MRNPKDWRPTKFVFEDGHWRASRDPAQVWPPSRLVADILARQYARCIGQYARGRLLDHGCGQSPLYGIYRDKCDEVVGVDWQASLHDVELADVYADLNEQLPFPDDHFDTILSTDVVEHLWNPIGVLRELARITRPGGHIILGTPFNYWIHEAPYDYFRWTSHALRKLGEDAGLEVVEQIACGDVNEVLADTLLKKFGGRMRLVDVIDKVARATGFVKLDRQSAGQFALANIAVYRSR